MVNFEIPKSEFRSSESYRYFINDQNTVILVLDEIQNVRNWESWVRIMLEKKENVKIIVTGSSAALLSGELGTKLTGRTLTAKIFPLDYKEFLLFKKGGKIKKIGKNIRSLVEKFRIH